MGINIGYEPAQMVQAKPNFNDELKEELDIFLNGIVRIEKTKRISAKVDGEFRFIMKYRGKQGIIDITNKDLMAGSKHFNDVYTYTFGIMLPRKLRCKPKKDDPDQKDYWTAFILEVNREAIEVEPNESDEWIETDRFIENIAKFPIAENKKIWADQSVSDRCLLKTERDGIKYYCARQDTISSVKDEIGIKLTIGNLGKALNGRGLKMQVNEKMTGLGRYRPTTWWFYADRIEDMMPPEWENDEEYRKTCEEDLLQTYKEAYDGDVNAYNEVDNVLQNNPHWNCKIK